MSTNINFDKKLGITGGAGITLPTSSTPSFSNTKSILLDGVDDFVNIGTTSLGITSTISVSAWVKIPTTNTGGGGTNIQVIACEDSTSRGKRNWMMFWRGTGFNYFAWAIHHTNLSASSVVSTSVVPNDGQWHHLLGTYDGTTNANGLKLYIDGLLNAQGTASSTGINSFTTTEPAIGSITGGGQWRFEGNIDEVSLFNTELSSTDVTTIYNSGVPNDITSLNPLSWWRCGDGDTAPTLTDNGSGGNNGTMTNFSTFSTDVPTAPSFSNTKSILLDGIDDYVDCGNNASLQPSNFTVCLWVKPDNNNSNRALIHNGAGAFGTSAMGFFLQQSYGNYYFKVGDGTTSYTSFNGGLIVDTWQFITLSYDGTNMRSYLDGVLQDTLAVPNITYGTNATWNPFYIGRTSGGSQYMSGNIDEVSLFNSELSSTDITGIYNSGVPNDISSLSPLSWWRCGDGDTAPTLTDNGSGGNDGTMQNFSTFSTDVPT